MTKVEEVARAIIAHMDSFAAGFTYISDSVKNATEYWSDYSAAEQAVAVLAARAASNALREPTPTMIAAGLKAGDVDDLDHTEAEIRAIWSAMIAAALSE